MNNTKNYFAGLVGSNKKKLAWLYSSLPDKIVTDEVIKYLTGFEKKDFMSTNFILTGFEIYSNYRFLNYI